MVGGRKPVGFALGRPVLAEYWPNFQGTALVVTEDTAVPGTALVEPEDSVFFGSNSGSGDTFQVLVR